MEIFPPNEKNDANVEILPPSKNNGQNVTILPPNKKDGPIVEILPPHNNGPNIEILRPDENYQAFSTEEDDEANADILTTDDFKTPSLFVQIDVIIRKLETSK